MGELSSVFKLRLNEAFIAKLEEGIDKQRLDKKFGAKNFRQHTKDGFRFHFGSRLSFIRGMFEKN